MNLVVHGTLPNPNFEVTGGPVGGAPCLTEFRVLEALGWMAFGNCQMLVAPDGRVLELHELPDEVMAFMQMETRYRRGGVFEVILRQVDKLRPLTLLARRLGMKGFSGAK